MKKQYMKPSVEVVVMKQQTALLAGSVQTTNYTVHEYEED